MIHVRVRDLKEPPEYIDKAKIAIRAGDFDFA